MNETGVFIPNETDILILKIINELTLRTNKQLRQIKKEWIPELKAEAEAEAIVMFWERVIDLIIRRRIEKRVNA